MRTVPRRFAYLIAGLVVVALAVLVLRPDPVPVEVATVEMGSLEVTVDEDGRTRVEDRYVVSAPVTGRMERLTCQVGDAVDAGEILALIHPAPLDTRSQREALEHLRAAEATRDAARARLAQATTASSQARRTLERLERVDSDVRGAVAEERLDAARSAARAAAGSVDEATGGLEAADHQVQAARAALAGTLGTSSEPTRVAAPAAGRVLRTYEECERVVVAGSPIVEVGDPASLEVVVDILTDDAVQLRPGAPARITVGPEAVLQGQVERIEPSAFTRVSPLGVEEQRVNVIVRLAHPATDDVPEIAPTPGDGREIAPPPPARSTAPFPALGDAYRVEVSLVIWQADEVTLVPVSALFRRDGGWGVFVVEGGRVREAPVTLGHRGRHHAEVTAGLTPGEVVVRFPPEALRDGAPVEVAGG